MGLGHPHRIRCSSYRSVFPPQPQYLWSVSSTAPQQYFILFSLCFNPLRDLCCVTTAQDFCPWVASALVCPGREVHRWLELRGCSQCVRAGEAELSQQHSQSRSGCCSCSVSPQLPLTAAPHLPRTNTFKCELQQLLEGFSSPLG